MKSKFFIKIVIFLASCALIIRGGYEYFVVATCYDLGGVFDEKTKQCRTDCLMISKVNGCVQLTSKQVELLKSGKGFTPEEIQEICLNNNLPYRKFDNFCDFDFDRSKLDELNPREWLF